MAVFNKKNALIGWAVMEAARIAAGRVREDDRSEETKKPRRVRKALAVVTGAAVTVGGVAAIRRRRGGQGPE